MQTRKFLNSVYGAVVVVTLTACAGPKTLEQAREVAHTEFAHASERAVGASAAVSVNGELVWSAEVGYADRELEKAATAETQYRMYSLIKPVTTVAALRLAQERKLDPDAPISQHLPDYPQADFAAQTTARMLATHTSGLRHYNDMAEAMGTVSCETPQDAFAIFAQDPLAADPGKRSYSTWGYVVLSAVMEAAADKPFHNVLEDLVFAPLDIRGLAPDSFSIDLPHQAQSYSIRENQARVSPTVRNSCKFGGGGYVADALSMGKFADALANQTAPITTDIQAAIFRGEERYSAIGWSEGGMGYLMADRNTGVSAVILTNTLDEKLGISLRDLLEDLVDMFGSVDQ